MDNRVSYATRERKRALILHFNKAFKNRIQILENDSFKAIKEALKDSDWYYDDEYCSLVEVSTEKYIVTVSPSLRLTNDVFNIALTPYQNGIDITRIEIFPDYQRCGYAGDMLRNMICLFISNGVYDVFVCPLEAGINKSSFSLNTNQLESFFFKRGFRKQPINEYWKLDMEMYLEYFKTQLVE